MPAIDLSLVLACYNEESHLESSVHQIVTCLDSTRLKYEIIFVDDMSQDATRAIIDRVIAAMPQRSLRRIFHEHNTGRGGAVTDGFRSAVGDIAGYIDVDLEVGPWYIPACYAAVANGADVVIGHRSYKVTILGLWRHVLSNGYRSVVRRVLPTGLSTDTESGYKFFRRSSLLPLLDQTADRGWFWDTEIVLRAWARGLSIAEVPCLYVRNFQKRSTVRSVQDSLEYLKRLWRFRRTVWPGLVASRRTHDR
jgi:glycosyltransferase involved in cell wall biosynthesis